MEAKDGTRVPSYRLHRASGQAIVTLGGRMHYLGAWQSEESIAAYERCVAEWKAQGRCQRRSGQRAACASMT